MKKYIYLSLFFLLAGLFGIACSTKSKYDRKLKQELASGERYDTLFMGIRLGMTDKDFYTHCWQLNKEGLIRQSTNNTSVERALEDELKYPATMNFYPVFGEKKIIEMPVRYIYNGWAPWNEELSSESLLQDVLERYKLLYGNDFITVEHPQHGKAHIKIDGNRRITLFKEDEMHVWAVFTDLSVDIESDPNSKTGAFLKDFTD